MTTTSRDTHFDDSLHLADGSHRGDPPATAAGEKSWRKRRADHVAQHIAEAMQVNTLLRDDAELHELADTASRVTEGRVHFVYTEQPDESKPKRYKFQGVDLMHSRPSIIKELHRVIGNPKGL